MAVFTNTKAFDKPTFILLKTKTRVVYYWSKIYKIERKYSSHRETNVHYSMNLKVFLEPWLIDHCRIYTYNRCPHFNNEFIGILIFGIFKYTYPTRTIISKTSDFYNKPFKKGSVANGDTNLYIWNPFIFVILTTLFLTST